jgi:hypothetical protein
MVRTSVALGVFVWFVVLMVGAVTGYAARVSFQDHDLGVIVQLVVGVLTGVVAAMAGLLSYWWAEDRR